MAGLIGAKSCRSCEFKLRIPQQPDVLMCRRYPPQVVVVVPIPDPRTPAPFDRARAYRPPDAVYRKITTCKGLLTKTGPRGARGRGGYVVAPAAELLAQLNARHAGRLTDSPCRSVPCIRIG